MDDVWVLVESEVPDKEVEFGREKREEVEYLFVGFR